MFSCLQKTFFSALIFSVLILVFFAACTSEKPQNPGVHNFREQMLEDFMALESKLIPALERNNPVHAVSKAIDDFLQELIKSDRRVYSIGLLDTSGEYLTGYVIDNKAKRKVTKDKYKNMNFYSFKTVEKILKSGKIMQDMLYLKDGSVLAIGFPVIKDGKLLGITCFSFKSFEFEKKWGISEKEFLKINFN